MDDTEIIDHEKAYHDLLMCVERKFANETRHETAKRYIEEAERRSHESIAVADSKVFKKVYK